VSATLYLRPHRLGTYFACGYLLPVSALIGITWYLTKPEYVGYDWIPAYFATMPWSRLRVWIPLGAILNAAVLYALGASLGFLIARVKAEPAVRETGHCPRAPGRSP
jgi:hypothetical protein